MLRVSLRGIAAHKIRLLLSATSVALGIAFLAGTLVLTDTLRSSVDRLQDTLSGGSDVSIRSESAVGGDASERAPVPASLLEDVRRVPGVASATGSSVGFAQIADQRGQVVSAGASVGISLPPDGVLQFHQGRAPSGPGEVAMDVASARKAGLHVGDRVTLLVAGPSRPARLVGLVGYGDLTGLPGSSVAVFDPRTAHDLLGEPGSYTTIEVAALDGVAPADLRQDLAQLLPPGLEALTGQQAAAENVKKVRAAVKFLPLALMVFVAISLFVSAFLIVNTFSMLVSQRSREFGLLRAVGATSRQVFRTVLVEALAVGLGASAIGFTLGVGAAHGLHWLLPAVGIELPTTSLQVGGEVAVISMLTGTAVTLVAALFPALRAGRVPPIVAILGLSTRKARRSRALTGFGSLLAATGVTVAVAGVLGGGEDGLRRLGLGALVGLLGLALLAHHLVRPMVAVLGRPWASRLGVPGRLGSDHAARNPHRTVMTAAALTIGLALVSLTSVFSASAGKSLGRALDEGQRADYLVASPTFSPFSSQVTTDLRDRREFATVVGLRSGSARVAGRSADLIAGGPSGLEEVVDLDVTSGSVEDLGRGGVLVHQDVAAARQWQVGDTIAMTFARVGKRQVRIAGIFTEKRLLGTDYVIGLADHDRWFGTPLDLVSLVKVADGVSNARAQAAFDDVLADQPGIEPRTKDEAKAEQERQLGQVLALVTGMLGLALVIALLGIVNTLALSVHERTREVGLLRAVGLSRRQLRRTIRYEAVIIALIGAATGVALGISGAAAVVRVLRDQGLTDLSIPVTQLGAYVIVAVLAGVLASAWPARRASNLDILRAISHD